MRTQAGALNESVCPLMDVRSIRRASKTRTSLDARACQGGRETTLLALAHTRDCACPKSHMQMQAHPMKQCAHLWMCTQSGRHQRPAPLAGCSGMPSRAGDSTTSPRAYQGLCVPKIAHAPRITHTQRPWMRACNWV